MLTFDFQLIGQMFLADICILLLLPAAWREFRRSAIPPRVRWLLITGIFWLISSIITDLVRQSPREALLRGWGEIALTLGALLVFYSAAHSNPRNVLPLLWGIAIGVSIRTWILPIGAATEVPWRLGGLTSLALIVLLTLLSVPDTIQRAAIVPSLLMLAGFAFLQESRNTGGILLAVALYLPWTGWIRLQGRRRPSRRHIAAAGVFAVVGSLGILQAYSTMAESGLLGESARGKYLQQEAGPAGLLITGRTDNVASILAIADSPLIGHGSRASANGYRSEAEYWLRRNGFVADLPDNEAIPTHSHFFGAWVQAGIGGAAFWLTAFWVSVASLLATGSRGSLAMRALSAFLALRIGWDIVFSPFGGLRRIYIPAYLVALVLLPWLVSWRNHDRPQPEPTSSLAPK